MLALGFEQHVDFATHKLGNTLDLVFTETIGPQKVEECSPGPFISDHCVVSLKTKIEKDNMIRKSVKYRKLDKIDMESMMKELENSTDEISTTEVDKFVDQLDQKMKTVLDNHAPEKSKRVTVRKPKPWMSEEIREQKRNVRRKEVIWRRHREPHQWQELKHERNVYNTMINRAKKEQLSSKIKENEKNTKSLYKIVSDLTGTRTENPMPPGKTDTELANDFADFFINKITTIRDNLEHIKKYKPTGPKVPTLESFKELTSEEVSKIINSMRQTPYQQSC
jgi:hypothetical protein